MANILYRFLRSLVPAVAFRILILVMPGFVSAASVTVSKTNLNQTWTLNEVTWELSISGTASDYEGSAYSTSFAGPWSMPSGYGLVGTINPALPLWIRGQKNGLETVAPQQLWAGVTQQYKVTVSLFNSRDVPVLYRLMQGTTQLGEVTLQPGTGLIQTFTTTNPAPVDVLELIPDLVKDGDTWTSVPGATTTSTVTPSGGLTPTAVSSGDPDPPAVPVAPAPDVPTTTKTDSYPEEKPVWKATTPNLNPTGQTDLLTNPVYRQGVDKIVSSIEHTSKQHDAAIKANPTPSSMASQGQAAGTAAANLYGTAPSAPVINSAGAAPLLSVTFPPSFGGKTVDFNPFSNERFATICSWFRTATAWLAIVLLGGWIWKEIGQWTRGLATIRQAQGNPVVGGTGAQATALIAASLITVAVVTAVTALLSWSFGEVGITVIKNTSSTNPLIGIPAGVLWMLDNVFPVSTLIICAIARATFNMYAAPLFATVSAVVRFIVP